MDNLTAEQYLLDCNEFFQPLDEVAEALVSMGGLSGLSNAELLARVRSTEGMFERVKPYMNYLNGGEFK
jgi:hypothetical protein